MSNLGWKILTELVEYMQDGRNVLWNLENLVVAKNGHNELSGTIEFHGGRCLTDDLLTKRWIAFTIGFIELVLAKVKPHDVTLTAGC
jgi:hypothetical protein